mmetsp:Transcript_49671/g.108072  ORF Transcript_49671/g.108072 Transcript_49671/m.108072 type:complete len:203 (-) Transcript_49671:562-1170(-)
MSTPVQAQLNRASKSVENYDSAQKTQQEVRPAHCGELSIEIHGLVGLGISIEGLGELPCDSQNPRHRAENGHHHDEGCPRQESRHYPEISIGEAVLRPQVRPTIAAWQVVCPASIRKVCQSETDGQYHYVEDGQWNKLTEDPAELLHYNTFREEPQKKSGTLAHGEQHPKHAGHTAKGVRLAEVREAHRIEVLERNARRNLQ